MNILIYMFEGSISNNKEKRNIAPPPLGRLLQNISLWISFINSEILIFSIEGPENWK